jgi:hypothetical protein
MQILIGDGSGKRLKKICQDNGMGRMLAQNWPELYENEPWGFDNGAWGFREEGWTPANEGKFLVRLNRAMAIPWHPYMAILPDIVAGGDKSLELSVSWIGNLPPWKWYVAVQDGMTVAKVVNILDKVEGIFLGGSDEYKKYAGYWCQVAHHLGKKFHYGRAGTMGKLAHAIMIGADSLDSAFPLWTKDRLFAFIQALSQQHLGFKIMSPHPEHGEGSLITHLV